MGLAWVGCVMLAFQVGLTLLVRADLMELGRSPRAAWRRLLLSPFTWLGLVFVVDSVSPPVAAALFGILMLAVLAMLVVGLVRGLRGLPAFVRQARRIGDPDAWRGMERPQSGP